MAAPAAELLLPAQFSAATRAGPRRDGRVVALGGATMGTRWSVRAVLADTTAAAGLQARIAARLAALEAIYSHWRADSALGRWNALPASSLAPLPVELAEVLASALAIAAASGGALDPTLGPLVDLWGFGPPGPRPDGRPPAAAELTAARARCGAARLHLDGRWLIQPGAMQLDLSGIAKGDAVDRIAALLVAAGIDHHLVEIGGELRGQGVKPDGQPWWVVLDSGAAAAGDGPRLALDGLAVATSGDAFRSHSFAGRRLAHTLDPATGAPLDPAPAAVSVIHPQCREADGWATALTVLGPVAGLALADRLGLAARWQPHGEPAVASAAWQALRDA